MPLPASSTEKYTLISIVLDGAGNMKWAKAASPVYLDCEAAEARAGRFAEIASSFPKIEGNAKLEVRRRYLTRLHRAAFGKRCAGGSKAPEGMPALRTEKSFVEHTSINPNKRPHRA